MTRGNESSSRLWTDLGPVRVSGPAARPPPRPSMESDRLRRARERVDQALAPLGVGPAYPVSDGDRLHFHIDCDRCGASVRVEGQNVWRHWRRHHRVKAWIAEAQTRRAAASTNLGAP